MSGLFGILFLAALVGVFKPYINGVKRWQFGLGAIVSLVLVGAVAPRPDSASNKTIAPIISNSASTGDVVDAGKAIVPPPSPEPPSNWTYSTEKDEMRGTESNFAQVEAHDTINLDFPYGEQRGRILVRKSAKFGFDVLVGVPSGQVMCNSFSNSHISVKFDSSPIRKYGCTDASDGSSSMVFIEGAKGFLANLKKSKRVVIEAEFFQNGLQQMTFETANLKWED